MLSKEEIYKVVDEYTSKFLFEFENLLNKAEDIEQYMSLIFSTMIFEKLVLAQFKTDYEQDNQEDNVDDIIKMLDSQAKEFVDNLHKQQNEKKN